MEIRWTPPLQAQDRALVCVLSVLMSGNSLSPLGVGELLARVKRASPAPQPTLHPILPLTSEQRLGLCLCQGPVKTRFPGAPGWLSGWSLRL